MSFIYSVQNSNAFTSKLLLSFLAVCKTMASRLTQTLKETSASEDKEISCPSGKPITEKAKALPIVDSSKPGNIKELPETAREVKPPEEKIASALVVAKVQALVGCSKEIPVEIGSPSRCPSYKLPDYKTTLSPLIKEDHYRDCYRRVYKTHYGLKLKQEKEAKERRLREPGKPEGYYESLENKDEISIRGWLKYALPREAAYLLSLVSTNTEPIAVEPPHPEDDKTYSLSEGLISEDNIESWKAGAALGTQLIQVGRSCESIVTEIKAELDPEQFLQREYLTEDLSLAVITIENEIAKCLGLKLPHPGARVSTSTSYDLDDEDTSKGLPILHTDSAATDVDSEFNSDSMSDISDCLRRNSLPVDTPSSGSAIVSDSSGGPSAAPSLDKLNDQN